MQSRESWSRRCRGCAASRRVEVEGACQVPDSLNQSQNQNQPAASQQPDNAGRRIETPLPLCCPLLPPALALPSAWVCWVCWVWAGGASWQPALNLLSASGSGGVGWQLWLQFGSWGEPCGAREKRNGCALLGATSSTSGTGQTQANLGQLALPSDPGHAVLFVPACLVWRPDGHVRGANQQNKKKKEQEISTGYCTCDASPCRTLALSQVCCLQQHLPTQRQSSSSKHTFYTRTDKTRQWQLHLHSLCSSMASRIRPTSCFSILKPRNGSHKKRPWQADKIKMYVRVYPRHA